MANPQIDQFMNALIWKAVPPIILASIGALLLREGLEWLERKATAGGSSLSDLQRVDGEAHGETRCARRLVVLGLPGLSEV